MEVNDIIDRVRALDRERTRLVEESADHRARLNHLYDQLKKKFDVESIEDGRKLVKRLEQEEADTREKLVKWWKEYERKFELQ